MSVPAPRSMLVEHPALPLTFVDRRVPSREVPISSLGTTDRRRIAVQLLSLAALLADFELWPGRRAMLRARVEETDDGLRARLGTLPVSLSRLWVGLGGGNPAAEATREAVLGSVRQLTGVDFDPGETGAAEPGFFLDGVIADLLASVDRPLDGATARALWLWRWSLPDLVPPGDTELVAIPNETVARRIGAALWASAVREGRGARFELATEGAPTRLVAERPGGDVVRVVAGSFDEKTLADLVNRPKDGLSAAVALGRFTDGWNPGSREVFDPARLSAHLAAVGIPPARRLRMIDGLAERFDPFSVEDRRWLTDSASEVFNPRKPLARGRAAELVRVAALAPDGLPVDRALELAGASREDLASAREQRAVILRRGKILPRNDSLMKVDPRHAEIARLIDEPTPVRRLHQALATGNPEPVLDWSRERLDDLDAGSVRRLLSRIEPGSLGPVVQAALAEACLALADIHGARKALLGLQKELAKPWRDWLDTLDRMPGREIGLPRMIDLVHAPRACAEVALVELRRSVGISPDEADAAKNVIAGALQHLNGACRRWVEIRLDARLRPELIEDRSWRVEMSGGHSEIEGLLLFEQSTRAILGGEIARARRTLRRAMAAERAPGWLALMTVNLGYVEATAGRQQVSEALNLAAYRLFQTAGFRHRTWEALHNLAVADIDQLRVRRAAARLDPVSETEGSVVLECERVRLDLARGRLGRFRAGLERLPEIGSTGDPQIDEAVSFLRGVESLFFGSVSDAVVLLTNGGDEGEPWIGFIDAILGRAPADPIADVDGWGVGRAAELARRLRAGEAGVDSDDDPDLKDAMAAALCCRTGLRPAWLTGTRRRRAVDLLARHGLDGWASSLRWEGGNVDRMLGALRALIRGRQGDTDSFSHLRSALPLFGVEGLVVRVLHDGRELLRVGDGEPTSRRVLGRVELVALGGEPAPGPGWDLLSDLVDLLHSTDREVEIEREATEVRIDGVSAPAARLRAEIMDAAEPRFTVLIHGETGTGKEVVAKEIHRLSNRPGNLVTVNVAAILGNLLEAELFGSVKGAFTGADRSRRGLVAAAEGGTLFLDEVGDLDIALQVKLLRFLESGEIRSVGADRTRRVDVRVICATHRNLQRRVREGGFREDLFYRIAVARIDVPPLRDRPEDIPILRRIFEREAAVRHRLKISTWTAAAEEVLAGHAWPGNIRELKHTVEVAMARAGGRKVRPDHLPMGGGRPVARGTWERSLAGFKRQLLDEVLTRHHGNRSAAARELGISRQALLYQIKKLGLNQL